jgi:hypothetical protein
MSPNGCLSLDGEAAARIETGPEQLLRFTGGETISDFGGAACNQHSLYAFRERGPDAIVVNSSMTPENFWSAARL